MNVAIFLWSAAALFAPTQCQCLNQADAIAMHCMRLAVRQYNLGLFGSLRHCWLTTHNKVWIWKSPNNAWSH